MSLVMAHLSHMRCAWFEEFLIGGYFLELLNGKRCGRVERSRCVEDIMLIASMKHADRSSAGLLKPMARPHPHAQPTPTVR